MAQKIKKSNGQWITLNEQQDEALSMMKDWLGGNLAVQEGDEVGNPLLFCLSGYAGTGKTTIAKELIDWYKNRRGKGFIVTAPTHKAKKEISNATGIEGKTIQALLGLAPNINIDNFDINKPEFAVINKPLIERYSVIGLDEGSMLNLDLYTMIVQQATMFGVKILFMCDVAQLPPVKEEISPVIISESIAFRYQLTKVERQADSNPLMLIYDAIRSNINSPVDLFKHTTQIITVQDPIFPDKTIELGAEFVRSLQEFGGKLVKEFWSKDFREDGSHCKMICWTNDQVKYWNNAIRMAKIRQRQELYKDDLEVTMHDALILPNELLMGYANYSEGITNSAEYKIIAYNYEEKQVEFGNFIDGKSINGREGSIDVTGYSVVLEDVDNAVCIIETFIVEPTKENHQNFLIAFNWWHSQGKFNRAWPQYYNWKADYLLIKDIKAVGGSMIVKKDLDYAYAITTHKSQGSTYNKVFVDEQDMDNNPNATERNKLKYVALSRPRQKAIVFTSKTD